MLVIAVKAVALMLSAIIFFGVASVFAYRAITCEDNVKAVWRIVVTLFYMLMAVSLWVIIVRLLFPGMLV